MNEPPLLASAPYRRWVIAFALVAVVAGGYFFYLQVRGLARQPMRSAIAGWDNSFYFYWLRSPLWGGELDFSDDLRDCPTLQPALREIAQADPRTELGLMRNKYGVGWAVATAPSYVLADAFVHAWRIFAPASAPREDGVGPAYQAGIFVGQLGLVIASLVLATFILRHWFPSDVAALAVLTTWLGSFLFYYQTVELSTAHNVVFFALTACYASALWFAGEPERLWPWILCGLSGGLLVITRYQTAVYLLYPVVLAILTKPGRVNPHKIFVKRAPAAKRLPGWPDWWTRTGLATACFAGVVFIQLYAWKSVYGRWLVDSYEGEGFQFASPWLQEVLFSPFHGLFYWSPALALGAGGFILWLAVGKAARWRRPEICWLVSLAATSYLNAAWSVWWFGASFGSRAFEGCVLFFMAGTACLLYTLGRSRWRYVLLGVVGALIVGNLTLALAFRKSWIPAEAPVTHAEMWDGVSRGLFGPHGSK